MRIFSDPNGHYCGNRVVLLISRVRSNIILRSSRLSFATLETVEMKKQQNRSAPSRNIDMCTKRQIGFWGWCNVQYESLYLSHPPPP